MRNELTMGRGTKMGRGTLQIRPTILVVLTILVGSNEARNFNKACTG
jgi:hypothetical protein